MTDEELLDAPQPIIIRSKTLGVVEKCGLCEFSSVSRSERAALAGLRDHFEYAHRMGGEPAMAEPPGFIHEGRPSETDHTSLS